MELNGRKATWLELAVAPLWRLGQTRVRIHALGGGAGGCLGITVDERWLCANDGRLSVFGCRDSATRFLALLRIDHMDDGAPADLPIACNGEGLQCMRLSTRGLSPCEGRQEATPRADGPRRIVIQSPPRRASFSTEFRR